MKFPDIKFPNIPTPAEYGKQILSDIDKKKSQPGYTPEGLLTGSPFPDSSSQNFSDFGVTGNSYKETQFGNNILDYLFGRNAIQDSGDWSRYYFDYFMQFLSAQMQNNYNSAQSDLAYERQRYETDLAYDRTKFATLFNQFLAAGMSPAAALQAASGSSPSSSGAAPSAAPSAGISTPSFTDTFSSRFNALNGASGNLLGLANMLQQRELSVANLVQTRDMFDISNVGNYQLQEGLDLLRPILGEWYNMYLSGNAPLDDSALLSPRHYLEWAQKQPSDSPHKKLVSSSAFAALMSNPAGYNAWNQFLQGNSNPYGWSGYLGRQADDRHKLDFGQIMLNKVNYDTLEKGLVRLSLEVDDFKLLHDIVRDETLVRLQYSQFQYQQYNTPEARQKWRESMLADLDMQKANAALQVVKADRISKGISKFDEEGLSDVLNASAAMEYFGFDSWSRRAISVAAASEDIYNDVSADASDVSTAFHQAVVDNSSAVLQWIYDYNGPASEFSKRFTAFLLATNPIVQSSLNDSDVVFK